MRRCVENLRGEGVDVCCVVGFHEGTYSTEEKVKYERDIAIFFFYFDSSFVAENKNKYENTKQTLPSPLF